MKKLISISLVLAIASCFFMPVHATNEETIIDDLLSPFQEAIDEVNSELGSSIYIPDENKESVYDYYKDFSMTEFKQAIRADYLQFVMNQTDTIEISNENPDNRRISKAITEDIVQSSPIPYESTVYLYSTVFGGGTPITYTYQSINGIAITWPSYYTGYHFDLSSWSHTLSSDRKTCTVTLNGRPTNAAGLSLTLSLKTTVTFNAN